MRIAGILLGMALMLLGVLPVEAIAPGTVLKRIEKSWAEIEQLQADLRQSVDDLIQEDITYYVGSLYIQRREDFRLDYQEYPEIGGLSVQTAGDWIQSASFNPQDIFRADTDFLWHYDRVQKSVTKQYLTQSGLPPILQLLAGAEQFIAEEFEENYYVEIPVEEPVEGWMAYLLKFTPKGEGKEERIRYRLWVDQKTYLPLRFYLESPEQQIDIYLFNIRRNEPLPENIFKINPPPGIDFIDRTSDL